MGNCDFSTVFALSILNLSIGVVEGVVDAVDVYAGRLWCLFVLFFTRVVFWIATASVSFQDTGGNLRIQDSRLALIVSGNHLHAVLSIVGGNDEEHEVAVLVIHQFVAFHTIGSLTVFMPAIATAAVLHEHDGVLRKVKAVVGCGKALAFLFGEYVVAIILYLGRYDVPLSYDGFSCELHAFRLRIGSWSRIRATLQGEGRDGATGVIIVVVIGSDSNLHLVLTVISTYDKIHDFSTIVPNKAFFIEHQLIVFYAIGSLGVFMPGLATAAVLHIGDGA